MSLGKRILSIDDSPIIEGRKKVKCFGVVSRQKVVEGILSFTVTKDGLDSTKKIIKLLKKTRFSKQIKLILVHSITLAGFNIIDIQRINKEFNIPIICLTRRKPNKRKVEKALKKLPNSKERIELINKAGPIYSTKKIYFHCAGIDEKSAKNFLKQFKEFPWQIRLAHLISSAVVLGESKGRA